MDWAIFIIALLVTLVGTLTAMWRDAERESAYWRNERRHSQGARRRVAHASASTHLRRDHASQRTNSHAAKHDDRFRQRLVHPRQHHPTEHGEHTQRRQRHHDNQIDCRRTGRLHDWLW